MNSDRLYHLGFALILAGGIALRLPRLELRPMHGDEAVHAVKFDTLWHTGDYVYDLREYHGPVLYYATLPAAWFSGAQTLAETSEDMFRVVPALFGVGLILLLVLLADGLGRGATLVAALLIAASPIMSFYSRYYIQEMLLAFFSLAVIGAGWRYLQTRRPGWAMVAGVAVGLMHATKETSVISLGCMAAALAGTALWMRRGNAGVRNRESDSPRRQRIELCDLVPAAVIAVLVSVLFYSAFFRHWRGPLDSLLAFGTYFDRAGGHGVHDHPWYYYLNMLGFTHLARGPWWSEGIILILALAGIIAVGMRSAAGRTRPDESRPGSANGLVRFLALYALLMTILYSAIPYKTPWCAVQFVLPLILLAGVGAAAVFGWARKAPVKVIAALVLAAGTAHLGWQAYRANFRLFVDYRNPYIYAHPLMGVTRVSDWLEKLAAVHPDGRRMVVKVIVGDPWPLPWYLRRFERVGYWDEAPADPDAPVVVLGTDQPAELRARFEKDYKINYYGLRPDIQLLVCVQRELWQDFARREENRSRLGP